MSSQNEFIILASSGIISTDCYFFPWVWIILFCLFMFLSLSLSNGKTNLINNTLLELGKKFLPNFGCFDIFFCLVILSNEFSKICDFDIYGPCPCPTYSPIVDWTEIPFNALNSAFSKVLIYLLSRALMLWSLHFSLKFLVHKQPQSHVQSSKVFPDQ